MWNDRVRKKVYIKRWRDRMGKRRVKVWTKAIKNELHNVIVRRRKERINKENTF